MMVLPFAFIPFIVHFPAGLVLYWMTTNLWTVGQGLITRRLMPKVTAPAKTGPRRSSRTPPKEEQAEAGAAAGAGSSGRAAPQPAGPPRKVKRKKKGAALMELQVEATGETVGEAKWAALRELERSGRDSTRRRALPGRLGGRARLARRRLHAGPGDRDGLGGAAARVAARRTTASSPREVRELVERIVAAIGVRGRDRRRRGRRADHRRVRGPDLGMLIGRHGQTIDAVQYLANAIMYRAARRRPQGRGRRRGRVPRAAACDARGAGGAARGARARERRAVELEPMTRGRAEGRPHAPEGVRRRRDGERGHGAATATSSSARCS